MRKEFKVLVVVLLMLSVVIGMTGCKDTEDDTSNMDRYETLEEADYEFLVFYDPSAKMLLQSFSEHHPEIDIRIVEIRDGIGTDLDYWDEGLYLKAMIKQHGLPDLILGGKADGNGSFISNYKNGIDLYDLPACYDNGYILDLRTYCANDETLDPNAYFSGTFDVFQDKEHMYALPLGITMDFMVTTTSKYNGSSFSNLEDGYTGQDLMTVLLEEVEKERKSGEFFCPEDVSAIRLLYQMGGVTQTETEIQVDEDLFKQVYDFTYMNDKQRTEAQAVWLEEGKRFSSEEGFSQRTAFEPRAYEGEFTVSFWGGMDAPAIALSYATTANKHHLDEETTAIYIPNKDDGNTYTASVGFYGAIGAESGRPELAYELLRMLMDEEISYFKIHDDTIFNWVNGRQSYNMYPVNKERALELLESFEKRNAMMLYGHLGNGKYYQILDIVEVSEEERAKHEKMLNGISGMTYLNYDMREASSIIGEYQYLGAEDYKGCYDLVVKALNAALEK